MLGKESIMHSSKSFEDTQLNGHITSLLSGKADINIYRYVVFGLWITSI